MLRIKFNNKITEIDFECLKESDFRDMTIVHIDNTDDNRIIWILYWDEENDKCYWKDLNGLDREGGFKISYKGGPSGILKRLEGHFCNPEVYIGDNLIDILIELYEKGLIERGD